MAKNFKNSKGSQKVEIKRGISLTPNGYISYGMIAGGEKVIPEDKIEELKALEPHKRHAALEG